MPKVEPKQLGLSNLELGNDVPEHLDNLQSAVQKLKETTESVQLDLDMLLQSKALSYLRQESQSESLFSVICVLLLSGIIGYQAVSLKSPSRSSIPLMMFLMSLLGVAMLIATLMLTAHLTSWVSLVVIFLLCVGSAGSLWIAYKAYSASKISEEVSYDN